MNFDNIKIGMQMVSEKIAGKETLASYVKSGSLDVFATPQMILFIEQLAHLEIDALLPDEFTSVGTKIDIEHVSATPVGCKIKTILEVIGISGREITIKALVYDEKDLIGQGTHKRFIVERERFIQKTNLKKNI